jgi:hypothetical protein
MLSFNVNNIENSFAEQLSGANKLIEVYRRFRSACCFHHQGDEVQDGELSPDYTPQHVRRQTIFIHAALDI